MKGSLTRLNITWAVARAGLLCWAASSGCSSWSWLPPGQGGGGGEGGGWVRGGNGDGGRSGGLTCWDSILSYSWPSVTILASSRLLSASKAVEFLTNVRHLDNYKSGRGLHLQVESHETSCGHSGGWYPSFDILSRNSWLLVLSFSLFTRFYNHF